MTGDDVRRCDHCGNPKGRCMAEGVCYDRAAALVAALLKPEGTIRALMDLHLAFEALEPRFPARVWGDLFTEALHAREDARTGAAARVRLRGLTRAQLTRQLREDITSARAHADGGAECFEDTPGECSDVVIIAPTPLPTGARLLADALEGLHADLTPSGGIRIGCQWTGRRRTEWCEAVAHFLTERGWSAAVEVE